VQGYQLDTYPFLLPHNDDLLEVVLAEVEVGQGAKVPYEKSLLTVLTVIRNWSVQLQFVEQTQP
jgi:hypothetical protein